MKTMTLLELNKRIGSDLMLELYKRMPGFSLFLEKLPLDEWLNIHQKAKSGEQKKEVVEIIKETFGLDIIASPIVGTFFEPLVKVDEHVESDTVVCGVEAMTVDNPVKAGVRGTITEVLAKNGQAVDYNQALFVVKPDL